MATSPPQKRLFHDYSDEENSSSQPFRQRKEATATTKLMYTTIACLIASNLYLIRYDRNNAPMVQCQAPSKFSELTYDTPTVYQNYTDYMSSDSATANNLWANIDTSPMVVALNDDWAIEHDLPLSVFRFPWDQERKGLYYLKVYHGLHCLKVIQKAFSDYERGTPPQSAYHHVSHCLDALRQDLICTADDTPMPMTDLPNKVGQGQVRMCRNFDNLIKWSHEPERHACYHRWSDYESVKKDRKIEMFAFCREDSEYFPLMQAYFEKWGHKAPYGE